MDKPQQITQDTLYFFALACVIFIPFPFYIFPYQAVISQTLFGAITSFFGYYLFQVTSITAEMSSDSTHMYLLVFVLALLALIAAITASFFANWQRKRTNVLVVFRQVFCYYLALQLFKYGFDKVFKAQFYLPEPNTLFTPLGQLSKDILFWSTMGASYGYTVFGGVLEVFAGGLILFNKTRAVGLLIAIGILGNVVAINFGFDISVKIYSIFLLLLALLLLSPQFKRLFQFLVLQQNVRLKVPSETMPVFFNKSIRLTAKTFVIGMILLETLYPYIASGNFNDDNFSRPYLHGAYEVIQIKVNNQPVPLPDSPVKRVFVHRRGFIILQNQQGQMQDFKLEVNQVKQQLLLTDYQLKQTNMAYTHHPKDSTLTLQYTKQRQRIQLQTKAINWRNLPTIKTQFHWRVDGVK